MKTTFNPGYYRITHKPTGKFFFGACADLDAAIYLLRYKLDRCIHSNVPLRDTYTNWRDCEVETFSTVSRLEASRQRKALVKEHSDNPLCCNAVIGGNHGYRFMTTEASRAARNRGNTAAHNEKIRVANIGRKHSPEALAKMRERKPKRKVRIEGVVYNSVREAAEALGLPYGTVRSRADATRWPEWVLL